MYTDYFERELDRLESEYENGEISDDRYAAERKAIMREWREVAEEEAQKAAQETRREWGMGD